MVDVWVTEFEGEWMEHPRRKRETNRTLQSFTDKNLLFADPNMTEIHDGDGDFIAPAPMYPSYKTVLHAALENHDREASSP